MKGTKKEKIDRVCKDFMKQYNVGDKVNGVSIFDIAQSNDGKIYVIVPLHEFAEFMNKHTEADDK